MKIQELEAVTSWQRSQCPTGMGLPGTGVGGCPGHPWQGVSQLGHIQGTLVASTVKILSYQWVTCSSGPPRGPLLCRDPSLSRNLWTSL